jgi:hypothetical protein
LLESSSNSIQLESATAIATGFDLYHASGEQLDFVVKYITPPSILASSLLERMHQSPSFVGGLVEQDANAFLQKISQVMFPFFS